MAFVFRANHKRKNKLSQLGPGTYSTLEDHSQINLSFAPFNSSSTKDQSSILGSKSIPGPGHYSYKGMADQKYIIATQLQTKKLVQLPKPQASFISNTNRNFFQKKYHNLSQNTYQQKKTACKLLKPKLNKRNYQSTPSIPIIQQGFGYNIQNGKIVANPNPIRNYKGTKQDSVGVGNYNISQSLQNKIGVPFSKLSQQRQFYKIKPSAQFYNIGIPVQSVQIEQSSPAFANRQKRLFQQRTSIKNQLQLAKYIRDKQRYLRLAVQDNQKQDFIKKLQNKLGPGQYYNSQNDTSFKKINQRQIHFGSLKPRFNYKNKQETIIPQAIKTTKLNQNSIKNKNIGFGKKVQKDKQRYISCNEYIQTQKEKKYQQKKAIYSYSKQQKIKSFDINSNTPGPGAYQNPSNKTNQLKSCFKSNSKRQLMKIIKQVPSPAAYQTQKYRCIGNNSKQKYQNKLLPFITGQRRFYEEYQNLYKMQQQKLPIYYQNLQYNKPKDGYKFSKISREQKDYFLKNNHQENYPSPANYNIKSGLNCFSFNKLFKSS